MLDAEIAEKASPEGDHQQHGSAEASVREVKGQARDVEASDQRQLQADGSILA